MALGSAFVLDDAALDAQASGPARFDECAGHIVTHSVRHVATIRLRLALRAGGAGAGGCVETLECSEHALLKPVRGRGCRSAGSGLARVGVVRCPALAWLHVAGCLLARDPELGGAKGDDVQLHGVRVSTLSRRTR